MYSKKKFNLIVLLMLSVSSIALIYASEDKLTIYSPSYFDEQNNIYDDIHYLENEALSFDFCTAPDAKNIRFYISCASSENDIEVVKNYNKEGCYFSNYNLRDIQCSKFDLFIDYEIGSKKKIIKRTFQKQKESLLVNHILEKDYKILNDIDLSYFLIVLNDIQEKTSSQSNDVYETLKNSRNNNDKCWPKNNCNLETTTSILRNLKMATYEDDSRMLEDGKIYLERKTINDLEGTKSDNEIIEYEFEIDMLNPPSSTIECDLEIDSGSSRSYEFDSSSEIEDLRIEKIAEDNIFLTCDNTIDEISLKIYKEKLFDEEYFARYKTSYTIGSSSLSDYSDFKYRIRIDHSFSSGEEIECELDVDDLSTKTYTFDEDSDFEDLLLEDYFNDEFAFECDDDLDFMQVDVYADIEEEIIYDDEYEIDFDIDFTSQDKFDFKIFIEYDFNNDDEELLCALETDASRTKNYKFKESNEKSGIITIDRQQASSGIKFTCDKTVENIEFNLFDIFDRRQVKQEYSSVKTFSYTITSDFSNYECIGQSQSCLYSTNINSLIAFEKKLEKSSSLEKFVNSFIVEGSNNEKYVYDSNALLDTGRYLYLNNDNDLADYLKFEQNNDGSWGTGADTEKITPASWAVIGLQESDKDSEHVDDGKKWIYYNEPILGWGTLEKNSLAYYAIKEKLKPYLKITAENEIYDSTKFEIENPTIYHLKDIKVTFDNSLDEYLSFTQNLGDLEGQDYREFNLTSKGEAVGDKTGMMSITGVDGKNKEIELLKMPINVKGLMPFEIKTQNSTISSENNQVKILKTNTLDSYSYDCSYTNPFSKEKETVTITEKTNNIQLLNQNLEIGEYSFDMICLDEKHEFTVPVRIGVELVNKTIEVNPSTLFLESYSDFAISVTNIGEKIETITLGVGGDYIGYISPSENTKTLAVGETRDIYFVISNPDIMNTLSENATGHLIVRASNGFEKKIPIDFFIVAETQNSLAWYWYAIIGIITFALIAFLVWRRKQILEEQQKEAENQKHNDEFVLDDELDF